MDADRQVMKEAMDSLRTIADQTDGTGHRQPQRSGARAAEDGQGAERRITCSATPRRLRRGTASSIRSRCGSSARTSRSGAQRVLGASPRTKHAPCPRAPKPGPPTEVANALEELAGVVEPSARKPSGYLVGSARGTDEARASRSSGKSGAARAGPHRQGRPDRRDNHHRGRARGLQGPVGSGSGGPPGRADRIRRAARAGETPHLTENARGQRVEQDDFTYDVADFTSARAMISTPMLFRARTAREITQLRGGDRGACRSRGRQFSRTERLLMRFDAYGPAAPRRS